LLGQFVLFQSVAKTQEGALIWQAVKLLKLCKLTLQRRVKEGFIPSRIRQRGPLLHELNAQRS
jgi:hypothetical protein